MREIYPATAAQVAVWAAQPDVRGVLLVGSHSQGYSDARSDDDLEVLLTDTAFARRSPAECSAVLRDPADAGGRLLIYDAQYLSLTALQAKVGSPHDLDHWPYQHARVLFDPDGQVAATAATLAHMDPAFRAARLRHGTIDAGIAARRAQKTLERGFARSARLLLARGAKALFRVLFALEGQWVPLDHWLEAALPALPDPTGAGPQALTALLEGRPDLLLAALAGLEDRLAAAGVPRPSNRLVLFLELVHPANVAERSIHGLS